MTNYLELEQLDFNDLPTKGAMIIAGPSGTGKTTIALDFIAAHRAKFSYASVFSGSEKYNHIFSQFIHPMLIHYDLTKSELERVHEFQAQAYAKDPNQKGLLVIDDQMSKRDFLRWPITAKLFYEARHINMLVIICTQYLLLLEPSYRTNANVGIVFTKQPSVEVRRCYHRQFFDGFPGFEKFDAVFRRFTSDYKVIFKLTGLQSYNPLDTIKFYCSPHYRNDRYSLEFRIGSEQLWAFLDELRRSGSVRKKTVVDILGIK